MRRGRQSREYPRNMKHAARTNSTPNKRVFHSMIRQRAPAIGYFNVQLLFNKADVRPPRFEVPRPGSRVRRKNYPIAKSYTYAQAMVVPYDKKQITLVTTSRDGFWGWLARGTTEQPTNSSTVQSTVPGYPSQRAPLEVNYIIEICWLIFHHLRAVTSPNNDAECRPLIRL